MSAEPAASNGFLNDHVIALCRSFRHWTGRDLIVREDRQELAKALYHSPAVVLSHNTLPDPLFTYANLAGQQLFEMSWETVLQTPSRHSAEPVERSERARLMEAVTTRGYIDDYRGVRISSTGKRFLIEQAVVWNVIDESGVLIGQAATFDRWESL
ncbi:MAG: MEKHLA domain-containing protein [Synoicihabitans sp.]